ncbi:MAG TPA: 50S ribosomal protein L23 [Chloroflexi bacterium]|nr:50S ribosomal protein L23 [Chloroflexota bacterium]
MSSIYDILRRPVVTEKTNYQAYNLNQYVFEVAIDATRSQIKDAVELLFDVEVLKVNINKMAGKRSRNMRTRQYRLRKSPYKKAIVTLAPEDRIPIFEGVE